jgi:hypothetical protein
MFIESSSFAASALTGAAVVNAGSTAIGFLNRKKSMTGNSNKDHSVIQ